MFSSEVVEILPNKISSWIKEKIKCFFDDVIEIHRPFGWKIKKDSSEAILLVVDFLPIISAIENMHNSQGLICIVWSERLFENLKSIDIGWNLISFNQLITDPDSAKSITSNALLPSIDRSEFWSVYRKLDKFVRVPDPKGRRFEGFCRRLLQEISIRHEFVHNFVSKVESKKPIARWNVALGGPAKTDIVRIDLYRYFIDFFRMSGNVECKSYRTSKFRRVDFNNALGHALRSGTDDIIFIVSTSNIEPWVWETIDRVYRMKKSYHYIVIDLEILAYIIQGLELEHLLEENYT